MISRREMIRRMGAVGAAMGLPAAVFARETEPRRHPIPSTGESLPVIGMGTSRTFDVGDDAEQRAPLIEVLRQFFEHGGTVIDSSPMYGRAESVIGDGVAALGSQPRWFAATKVWTLGKEAGIEQMQRSMARMRVARFDLMQIHNLKDWQIHLETLKDWKSQGKVRYIGITTSHGRYHRELERILRSEPFDFVQFSYNLAEREVEHRLLPLAADRGIATLINRPYQRGSLFRAVKGLELPAWSADFDCASWGQFFLKFIVSHPAVTCVIPATSKPKHLIDNMGAAYGRLPDGATRERMIAYLSDL